MSTNAPGALPTRWRRLLTLAAVAAVLVGAAACSPFPSVGRNFGDPGPYAVTVQQDTAHTYYSPTDLAPGGARHPVILWGNGTFLNPSHYDALLRHFASHGFIVAAANTSNAGSGQEMLTGLDNLTTFDSQAGNRFEGKVDLTRVATMGHSQGGGGAIEAAADPRVDTTVAIEPFLGTVSGLHGPTFFMAGENDTTILPSTVYSKYTSATVPAAYGELAGADHLQPIVNGNGFRAPATAWVRWQLMGDGVAREQFIGACAYCSSSVWSAYETNAQLRAL